MFDNKVLKKIFVPEEENVAGRRRKVYDVEPNYFQAAPNHGGWDGLCMKHAWMEDKDIKAFVEKPEGNNPL